MAQNDFEQFFRKIPGYVDEPRDVDCVIGPSGDLRELIGIDAIIRSLTTLFLIPRNSYFMDPEIGVGIHLYLFEPADMVTEASVNQEVGSALLRYEDRADITFNVLFFSDEKGFRIDLYIDYKGKKKTVSIDIDESLLKTLKK